MLCRGQALFEPCPGVPDAEFVHAEYRPKLSEKLGGNESLIPMKNGGEASATGPPEARSHSARPRGSRSPGRRGTSSYFEPGSFGPMDGFLPAGTALPQKSRPPLFRTGFPAPIAGESLRSL